MSLSPELMEDFDRIKQELQKKYKRAQVYSDLYEVMPETARGNSFIVDALKPVIEVISKLDLNRNDSIDGLKEFSKRWQDVAKELPDIHHYLERFDGAYDDIWDNMSQVDKGISEFLENFDLQETPDIEKEIKTNEDKQKNFETVDLQHNMQKTDVAKTQDDVNKILEEQKIASKENSGNGNEAQEKAIREQIDESKKSDVKPKENLNTINESNRTVDIAQMATIKPNDVLQKKSDNDSDVKDSLILERRQDALNKIENFIMTYDNMFSSNDFGEAMHELDKFSRYVLTAVREGLIPAKDGDKYKKIIGNIYGVNDWKRVSEAVEKMSDMVEREKNKDVLESSEKPKVVDVAQTTSVKPNDKKESFKIAIQKTKDLNEKRIEERMAFYMKKKNFNNSWGE